MIYIIIIIIIKHSQFHHIVALCVVRYVSLYVSGFFFWFVSFARGLSSVNLYICMFVALRLASTIYLLSHSSYLTRFELPVLSMLSLLTLTAGQTVNPFNRTIFDIFIMNNVMHIHKHQ